MPDPEPVPHPAPSLLRLALRFLKAVVIWLAYCLVTFLAVSFAVFMLLGSLGVAQGDTLFALSVVCAIPAALTVSSLVINRKLIYLAIQRYQEKRS